MTWAEYWRQVRSLAFGEMGMKPVDFYCMSLEDFSLKVEGFFDARIWEERTFRRLAQVLQAPHVTEKAPSMLKQWPISKDDESKARERTDRNNLASAKKILDNDDTRAETAARSKFGELLRVAKNYNQIIEQSKKPVEINKTGT